MLTYPEVDPVAFSVGPLSVRWYALAYAAGLLASWWGARRLAAEPGRWGDLPRPSPGDVDDLVLWGAVGVIVGGRIGYVLFYNLPHYLSNPLDVLAIRQGGMSFHGGLAGAVLAALVLARSRGLRTLSLIDLSAAVAPFGLVLGRVANFVNGELWGRVAPGFPLAMVFPGAGPLPRHPSQLYEAATEGLLLLAATLAASMCLGFARPGRIAGTFALGYAVARTACEAFREPDRQLGYLVGDADLGLTMGMLLSVPLAFCGLWLLVRRDGRKGVGA